MLFPTLDFGLFFLPVFALAWALHGLTRLRKAFLLAASYGFYAAWDWRFVGLLAGSSLANYGFGLTLGALPEGSWRRRVLAAAVAANLAVLCLFKYVDFFAAGLSDLLQALGFRTELPLLDLVLPVGISFYTFHGISYVVDVVRGRVRPARDPIDLMLYIGFFPHLVAGPIVRAAAFLPQLAAPADPAGIPAVRALLLILVGFFKKIVIAGTLSAGLVDPVFRDPAGFGRLDLLIAAYGYAAQIYCDFSGYTDMAIGIAALLGYRFPENFDRPYRAVGLRDFWRRWHMSLSSWLRDYLYIPLGGGRHGTARTLGALILTMLLGGLWHGAAWTFVFWGLLHGCGLALERLLAPRHPGALGSWGRVAGGLLTFHVVVAGWILFRSAGLEPALDYFAGIAGNGEPPRQAGPWALLLILTVLAGQFAPADLMERVERRLTRCPPLLAGLAAAVALFLIDGLSPEGVAPFIYFRF